MDDLPIPRGRLLGKYQRERVVYYLDGRQIVVRATLFLESGDAIAVDGLVGGCFEMNERCGVAFDVPIHDRRLVINKIRLTASAPLRVERLEWGEGVPM